MSRRGNRSIPKIVNQFTKKQIENIEKPGVTFIGHEPGLAIEISRQGTAFFILRVHFRGKLRQFSLGARDQIDVKQAATKAREIKQQLLAGKKLTRLQRKKMMKFISLSSSLPKNGFEIGCSTAFGNMTEEDMSCVVEFSKIISFQ